MFHPTFLALVRIIQFNGGGGNRTRVRRYSTRGRYMLILFAFLASRLLKRKTTLKPAPKRFARLARNAPSPLSCWSTFLKRRRKALKKRHAFFRQLMALFLHLESSTCLTRWVGPRHASSVSLPPSNPVRPQSHY